MYKFAVTFSPRVEPKDQLRLLQRSPQQESLPATVAVGDVYKGSLVVGLAESLESLGTLLQDLETLRATGAALVAQQQPQEQWRYYTLFRFCITDTQYAATVEEKVQIDRLGETQTTRIVGHSTPDELDSKCVWLYLAQFETPVGTVINGGLLDSTTAERFRSLDMIDTEDPQGQYRDWRPVPTMLLDNPCPTVTVEATPA